MLEDSGSDAWVVGLWVSGAHTGNIDDFVETIFNDVGSILRREALLQQTSRGELKIFVALHAVPHEQVKAAVLLQCIA